jgi:quercetin dioxygenase-like cupin family protein
MESASVRSREMLIMTSKTTAANDGKGQYTNGVTQFDLPSEIANAETRKPWPAGVFSKTLVKEQDMRVVLSIMEAGSQMKSHHADGSVSVQVLRGTVHLRAQAEDHELHSGQMLTLLPSIPHDLRASEPSAVLLTLSWPESEKLRAMPHRGYS